MFTESMVLEKVKSAFAKTSANSFNEDSLQEAVAKAIYDVLRSSDFKDYISQELASRI